MSGPVIIIIIVIIVIIIIIIVIMIIIMIIMIMIDVAQVKLVCPMEGNPAPIIEWSKGEQMVS